MLTLTRNKVLDVEPITGPNAEPKDSDSRRLHFVKGMPLFLAFEAGASNVRLWCAHSKSGAAECVHYRRKVHITGSLMNEIHKQEGIERAHVAFQSTKLELKGSGSEA
jgi:hypothetical protein